MLYVRWLRKYRALYVVFKDTDTLKGDRLKCIELKQILQVDWSQALFTLFCHDAISCFFYLFFFMFFIIKLIIYLIGKHKKKKRKKYQRDCKLSHF